VPVTINILTRFIDDDLKRAQREFDRLTRRVASQQGSLQRSLLQTGATMRRVGDSVAAAGQRLTLGVTLPIVGALAMSAKAASEEQANMLRLHVVLRNVTGATAAQVAAVERWVTRTEDATAVADDRLRPALAALVAGTGDVREAQDLLNVALDIAAARGKDVEQVARALAKAHQGSIGALSRLGIQTRDASGEMLTFREAVDKARLAYGGAARAFGATGAGALERLRNTVNNLAETIGETLLPYVQRGASWLTHLMLRFQRLSPRTRELVVKLALVAAALGPVLTVTGHLTSGIGLLTMALGRYMAVQQAALIAGPKASLGPLRMTIGLLRNGAGPAVALRAGLQGVASSLGFASVAAMGWAALAVGLVAGLVLLYVKCKAFRDAVNTVARVVGAVVVRAFRILGAVIGWLRRHWRGLVDAFLLASGPIGWLVAYIIHHWDACKRRLGQIWDAIRAAWDYMWERFRKTPIGQLVTAIGAAFADLVTTVRRHWDDIIRAVAKAVNTIGGFINKAFGWTGIRVPLVSWGTPHGSTATMEAQRRHGQHVGDAPHPARRAPRTGDALSSVAGSVAGAVDWLSAKASDILGFLVGHLPRLPRLAGPLAGLLPALLRRIAAALRRRIGATAGAAKGAYGWAYELARRFGLTVTSTFRPGARTASGAVSDHSVWGRAADLAGPAANMAALWRYLVATAGSWKQAIYRHGILDSGRLGYYAPSDHFDHVHVARGGVGDYSGPAPRPALAAAAEQHVHVHVHLPGGTALVGEAERVAEVLAPHVARAIDRAERRLLRG